MPAVKTGMTPPPMPGMPAPMQPMGGMPPAQNPFAPMPPMPLAGAPMPQPPMPMPPMPQGQPMGQMPQGQQMMASTAGRRRRFGDALEGMLGRNQGIGGCYASATASDAYAADDAATAYGCSGCSDDENPADAVHDTSSYGYGWRG